MAVLSSLERDRRRLERGCPPGFASGSGIAIHLCLFLRSDFPLEMERVRSRRKQWEAPKQFEADEGLGMQTASVIGFGYPKK